MKVFLHKLLKQPLLWAFLLMIILDIVAYFLFTKKESVLAAVTTGSVIMFGYFATHYFTMMRSQRERKFEQCLELIKKIRFFILEDNIKGTENQSKLRDELQDAYFAFALLTSEKCYKSLSEMMESFKLLVADPSNLCKFKEAQSKFINDLRSEFFIDKEIKFETYDLRLSQDKKEK